MGQYAFLINRDKRICCEAYKIGESNTIEEPVLLGRFLSYCREYNLLIECVDEHWFDFNINLETEDPYHEFEFVEGLP